MSTAWTDPLWYSHPAPRLEDRKPPSLEARRVTEAFKAALVAAKAATTAEEA